MGSCRYGCSLCAKDEELLIKEAPICPLCGEGFTLRQNHNGEMVAHQGPEAVFLAHKTCLESAHVP